ACGDIHAVAEYIIALDNDIAKIDRQCASGSACLPPRRHSARASPFEFQWRSEPRQRRLQTPRAGHRLWTSQCVRNARSVTRASPVESATKLLRQFDDAEELKSEPLIQAEQAQHEISTKAARGLANLLGRAVDASARNKEGR